MESIGKYRVLSVLGHGGSSSVYLVVDERIGKKWAVKVIPGRYIQKDGILLLRELDHPSLPRIVEELEGKNEFFEVTDYFEGISLDAWARQGISFGEAMSAAMEILGSAAYLHSRSVPVIHRDIKPGNFIVTTDRKIKLIDFDLAVAGERTGMVPMGTKGYAPPEQYRGVCSMRGDVYALGKTIRFLFNAVNTHDLNFFDRKTVKQVSKICVKATDLLPEKRFGDAGEMMAAFEKCYRTRSRVRPVLSACAASILCLILLAAGRGVLRDAFRVNSEQRVRDNFANAEALISEAVDLCSGQANAGSRSDSMHRASECAKKAVLCIENSEYLLKETDTDVRVELTERYYLLRHGAEIVAGSYALEESERTDAYRTCISDDIEYEKFLRKYGETADIFRLYRDDAELCRMIGDTGSSLRFFEEALAIPGISPEMRTELIQTGIGNLKEAEHDAEESR